MTIKILFILFLLFLAFRKIFIPFVTIKKNINPNDYRQNNNESKTNIPPNQPNQATQHTKEDQGEYIDYEEIK